MMVTPGADGGEGATQALAPTPDAVSVGKFLTQPRAMLDGVWADLVAGSGAAGVWDVPQQASSNRVEGEEGGGGKWGGMRYS